VSSGKLQLTGRLLHDATSCSLRITAFHEFRVVIWNSTIMLHRTSVAYCC